MWDFLLDGLVMVVGGLAACFGTVVGLGVCDFFLSSSALWCCGGCDGLVMGLCSE